MSKSKKKPRNSELGAVLNNNPGALKTKVREGKKRKEKFIRSNKKSKAKKEIEDELCEKIKR